MLVMLEAGRMQLSVGDMLRQLAHRQGPAAPRAAAEVRRWPPYVLQWLRGDDSICLVRAFDGGRLFVKASARFVAEVSRHSEPAVPGCAMSLFAQSDQQTEAIAAMEGAAWRALGLELRPCQPGPKADELACASQACERLVFVSNPVGRPLGPYRMAVRACARVDGSASWFAYRLQPQLELGAPAALAALAAPQPTPAPSPGLPGGPQAVAELTALPSVGAANLAALGAVGDGLSSAPGADASRPVWAASSRLR